MSVKIRHGLANAIDTAAAGRTVASILGDANLKAVLGFGDNVQARINGQLAAPSAVLYDGSVVDIETKANQKANEVSFTLRYGPGNQLVRQVSADTTVKSILTNASYRAVLGFGDGVVATVAGAVVRDDLYIQNGMVIELTTKANEKAA